MELNEINRVINGQPFVVRFDENGVWRESERPGQKRSAKRHK